MSASPQYRTYQCAAAERRFVPQAELRSAARPRYSIISFNEREQASISIGALDRPAFDLLFTDVAMYPQQGQQNRC
jgi:hypothetical protein